MGFIKTRISNYINRKVYKYGLKKAKWDKIHTIYFKCVDIKRKFDVPLKIRLNMYKNHFRADDYVRYDFEHNDMNNYINEVERWNTRHINGDYNIVFDNKNIFYEIFRQYFSIPHNIGRTEESIIYDEFNNIIELDDLINQYKKIVLKPIVGGGGKDIHMIEKSDEKGYILDGKVVSKEEIDNLLKNQQASIVNNFIFQHEYAKKLYPYSTNTIRVITIKDPDTNNIIIPYAIQRIGNDKSKPVDNVCSGGYFAHVDVETGKIKKAQSYDFPDSISIHPDSGAQIEGIVIPHWNEVKERLIYVATKFSYIPFIAWDVVITDESFSIIEGNASTGLGIIQMQEALKGTKLGRFYEENGVFEK